MTLDVFLESFEEFDRDAVDTALARNGIAGGNATVQTADGGEAQLELDDDGVVLFVRTLTRELADIVFDVAGSARLAILPADGSATAIVTDDVPVSDELKRVRVGTSRQLHETLQQSVAKKDRARGARQA